MKKKVLIVSASYYKNITKSLIDDSVKLLKKNRILYKNIENNRNIIVSKEFKNKVKKLSNKTSKDVLNLN